MGLPVDLSSVKARLSPEEPPSRRPAARAGLVLVAAEPPQARQASVPRSQAPGVVLGSAPLGTALPLVEEHLGFLWTQGYESIPDASKSMFLPLSRGPLLQEPGNC